MPDDILIVDDEADIRELVSGILQDEVTSPALRATVTMRSLMSQAEDQAWCFSTSGSKAVGWMGCNCSTL